MNIFQVIRRVLDGEYALIGGDDASKIAKIDARHGELATAYADLTDAARAAPDYHDAVTRFAYIYKYTTCHADMVYSSIIEFPELAALFQGDDWLKVASIGGGPGSDFLGVLKYALLYGTTKSLKCFLLDRETAWGDTWSEVEQHTGEIGFKLSTHFQPLDVTDAGTWASQTKYRSAQLFTFVYFLSEIHRSKVAADPFFKDLVTHANRGALFLFIDNDRPSFEEQITHFATMYGLQQLRAASIDYRTGTSEEKTDLDPYYSALSHSPKITGKIYRALMVKP